MAVFSLLTMALLYDDRRMVELPGGGVSQAKT
jgi:hypothetical protein